MLRNSSSIFLFIALLCIAFIAGIIVDRIVWEGDPFNAQWCDVGPFWVCFRSWFAAASGWVAALAAAGTIFYFRWQHASEQKERYQGRLVEWRRGDGALLDYCNQIETILNQKAEILERLQNESEPLNGQIRLNISQDEQNVIQSSPQVARIYERLASPQLFGIVHDIEYKFARIFESFNYDGNHPNRIGRFSQTVLTRAPEQIEGIQTLSQEGRRTAERTRPMQPH